jgi:glycerol-1-phosphate dehydrogenase [NAD(P)+]
MLLTFSEIEKILGTRQNISTEMVVVNEGCLAGLEGFMKSLGLTGPTVAVYDTNTYNAKDIIRPKTDQDIILPSKDLHADERAVNEALKRLRPDARTIIAVGAGTIHDISRYCAFERCLRLVSCPTAASVDGFCSNVAAMTWHGSKKTIPTVAPCLVVADLNVISAAPIRMARSGIGDMFGKYIALSDWKIASLLTGERYDEKIADTIAKAVFIVKECSSRVVAGNKDAYEQLVYGLLLSGLAMQAFGNSRPASGAEHHVSHLIEMHPSPLGIRSNALHGEKVGVGTLLMSESYHHFAHLEANEIKYKYSAVNRDSLAPFFGQLADALNEENNPDCLVPVKPEKLRTHWETIRNVIKSIPARNEMYEIYEGLGMMRSLTDIGVDESKKKELVFLSPLVRNRLTLARIMRCVAAAEEEN